MAVRVSAAPGGVRLDVRVMPRAPQDAIVGERDGRLVVRVTAPPVDRAANDAVVALIARRLGLPRRTVRIVSGESSRNKTIHIDGADEAAVRAGLLT